MIYVILFLDKRGDIMYIFSNIMGAASMVTGIFILGIIVVIGVVIGLAFLFGSKSDNDDSHKID